MYNYTFLIYIECSYFIHLFEVLKSLTNRLDPAKKPIPYIYAIATSTNALDFMFTSNRILHLK